MGQKPQIPSGYKAVWLFTMFDLPVSTKTKRLAYTRFRTMLMKKGFSMLQYSVYARYYASEEASTAHRKKIQAMIPPEGQVRFLTITDRQFGKMEVYNGKTSEPPEKPPKQLLLF